MKPGAISRLERAMRTAIRFTLVCLWAVVIPALLAGLALRELLPPAGTGLAGRASALAHGHQPAIGASLFLVFSALQHYWSHRVPFGLDPWRLGTSRPRDVSGAAPHSGPPLKALVRRGIRLAAAMAIGLTAVHAVRARFVETYEVLGESMLPTLEPADRVAADKLAYGHANEQPPGRGDLVVLDSSGLWLGLPTRSRPDALIKRVIGFPGDRIEMAGDVPVINGWTVPGCDAGDYLYVLTDGSGRSLHGRLRVEFIADHAYLTVSTGSTAAAGPYRVPAGALFVLGDNRSQSLDSRAFDSGRPGSVRIASIEGRVAWFVVGTHRSGEADFGRFLSPVDALEGKLRLEGLATEALESKVADCMNHRPRATRPPTNDGASTAAAI